MATCGVIMLTLRPSSYNSDFIEAGSGPILDTGSEACL